MLTFIQQKIMEPFYLLPFDQSAKKNLYALPVERMGHGGQHASVTAGLIIVFINMLRELNYPQAMQLTDQDIVYLQLTVLMHDCMRDNDKSADHCEDKSQIECQKLLESLGMPSKIAFAWSSLITQKGEPSDDPRINFLRQLMQSVDSLHIMRGKSKFYIERLRLWEVFATLGKHELLFKLAEDVLHLVALQHDLRTACEVIYQNLPIAAHVKTRNTERPELKQAYEQAPNCYSKCTADFAKIPLLKKYYHHDRLHDASLTILLPPEVVALIMAVQQRLLPQTLAMTSPNVAHDNVNDLIASASTGDEKRLAVLLSTLDGAKLLQGLNPTLVSLAADNGHFNVLKVLLNCDKLIITDGDIPNLNTLLLVTTAEGNVENIKTLLALKSLHLKLADSSIDEAMTFTNASVVRDLLTTFKDFTRVLRELSAIVAIHCKNNQPHNSALGQLAALVQNTAKGCLDGNFHHRLENLITHVSAIKEALRRENSSYSPGLFPAQNNLEELLNKIILPQRSAKNVPKP